QVRRHRPSAVDYEWRQGRTDWSRLRPRPDRSVLAISLPSLRATRNRTGNAGPDPGIGKSPGNRRHFETGRTGSSRPSQTPPGGRRDSPDRGFQSGPDTTRDRGSWLRLRSPVLTLDYRPNADSGQVRSIDSDDSIIRQTSLRRTASS